MPNHTVAACILAKHFNSSTERAIHSALKFNLDVHLGLTHDSVINCSFPQIKIFPIYWINDFADARNQLLDQVKNPFIIWLDSDEELFSFPKLHWECFEENIFYVRTQFNSQFTPRVHVRMHRNHPNIRWQEKIHERLTVQGDLPYSSRFISSLIIRHYGYEDEELVLKKHERNLNIAQTGLNTQPLYSELLTQARTETAHGKPNFLHWLHCYQTALSTSNLKTQPSYFGFESAFLMCIAGYSRPAEKLLEANPLNLYLQIAVIANKIKYFHIVDEQRIDFLEQCLQNGFYDVYENFPCELLGANKNKILNYIQYWIKDWNGENMNPQLFDDHAYYTKCLDVDEQKFDEDLLLMSQKNKRVVVLNSISTVLWQLLGHPYSIQELIDVLHEAMPDISLGEKKEAVQTMLKELHTAELIYPVSKS